MDDDDERRLRASGGIENVETNVGRAIHLLAAECLRTGEAIEQKAAHVFDVGERSSICIARCARVDGLGEYDELSRANDLSPAARGAGAIVKAELDHFGGWRLAVACWLLAVGCWRLAVGCRRLAVGCRLLELKTKNPQRKTDTAPRTQFTSIDNGTTTVPQ